MRADPLQLEPVLDLLCGLDWVQRLDEQKPATPPRYVLLCDPAATDLQPLLHAMLLQPGPATAAFLAAGGLQAMSLGQALGVRANAEGVSLV
jgi:membrane protein